MNEKITFVFENYPLYIVTSKAQRTLKYEFNKTKLLKKFLIKDVFQFNEGGCYIYKDKEGNYLNKELILNKDYRWRIVKINKINRFLLSFSYNDDIIVANPSKAGKEKTKVITGQNLHQLTMTTYDRAKVILTLKTYFLNILKNYILPKEIIYPVHIDYVFYSNDDKIKSDLNSHSLFYEKVFSDIIQEEIVINKEIGKIKNDVAIIADDDLKHYTSYGIYHCYLPKEEKNHYLIITVYDSVDNKHLLNKIKLNNLISLM